MLGLTLAFEQKEAGVMNRRPRDPKSPILTRPLIRRIFLVGLLLFAGSFGLFQYPALFVGVVTMTASQLLFTYLPAMQRVFGTASLGANEWMLIIVVGVVIYIVVEIEKKLSRQRAASSG